MSMQLLFANLPPDILVEVTRIESRPHTNGRHIYFKNGYIVSVQWGIGLHDGVDIMARLQQLENELPRHYTTEQYFDAWFNTPRDAPMAEMMIIGPDESWEMVGEEADPLTIDEILG